ncbi:hypothetical protein F5884DRAFT_899634 [Xylogone sp. PMI_703]|nr:hypothetical protein F5884DRAFT_899634 [Xylogone sp. PMI_703]
MGFFGCSAPFAEPLWYSRAAGSRYSESHQRVREETRAYIDKEIRPFCEEWEAKGEVPERVLKRHSELGYTAALFNPAALGEHLGTQRLPGDVDPANWDGLHHLICNDEVARCGSLGVIWALACGTSVGLPPVINFGTPEQRARFVPDVIRGKTRFCLALTEPDAGSDIANMATTAKLQGDVFIVNGTKKWITNGMWADYCTAVVRTGPPGREGLSLLVIPLHTKGIRRTHIVTSGVASSGCALLTFESVEVPVTNLLGTINQGFKSLMASLNTERLLISANCIRLARVCLEDAYNYAIKRETFGKPLIDRPTIRLKFTNMGAQIMGAWALLESLVEIVHQHHGSQSNFQGTVPGSDVGGICALTKMTSARALELAVRECQQILGAQGYTRTGPGSRVERISRDFRALVVGGGSEEIIIQLYNFEAFHMEPIAIIGSACCLPGDVRSPSQLWELLSEPRDVSAPIPSNRFSKEKFHHKHNYQHGTTSVSRSYFISRDPSHFDTQFFGIKPVEAKAIDPQQRILLEVVYEALESAGLPMKSLEGSNTSVYVGVMSADYEAILLRDPESLPTYTATGIARSMLANRISYIFDWHGPSMTIDTACSASIVAIHQAVQALRSHGGDTDLAIVAGSNLLLGPEPFIAGSKISMLSTSGRSQMWDEKADGYARGEGVGVLVLKPLSVALRDGDHIESLIMETGVNQDGRTRGITMPNSAAQISLIRRTYERAGLDLALYRDRCQYFEAHGTGTQAGDPIESEAIRTTMFPSSSRQKGEEGSPRDGDVGGEIDEAAPLLYVGSVKTVVGHGEGAAGVTGVLKASLAVQHGSIPPNLHFNKPNPKLMPFYEGYVRIPTHLTPWPSVPVGEARRASVNSFGFGGTNGHVIIESYDYKPRDMGETGSILAPVVISAATGRSLRLNIEAYHDFLKDRPDLSLHDLAWTTQCRRSCLPYRASFSGTSIEAICGKMEAALTASPDVSQTAPSHSPITPSILAIFTGQGAQWPTMGRDLILNPFVSRRLESLDMKLQSLPLADRPSWTLRSQLLADTATSRMSEAAVAQPLTTAIEILLWDLVCAAGIDKSVTAIVGHSGGETVAAYAAGFISAEDAICISYYRGLHTKLGQDPLTGKKGTMMAIESGIEDAENLVKQPHLAGKVCIAAYNSPESITLAGNEDAIHSIKKSFEAKKKFARLLKVDNAYHSHHMLSCSGPFLDSMAALKIKVSPVLQSKWFSSVLHDASGEKFERSLRGEYWNANMVQPVLFTQAISKAVESRGLFDMAIEIGPHPALKGPALKSLSYLGASVELPYTGFLYRGRPDIDSFSDGLGSIWKQLGSQAVNFQAFETAMGTTTPARLLKNLPTYRWDHESYWHESRLSQEYRLRQDLRNELLGSLYPSMVAGQYLWRNFLLLKEVPWLSNHSIRGQVIFPAAAYIAMALDATTAITPSQELQLFEVSNFQILQPLILNQDDTGIETIFSLSQISRSDKQWEAKFEVSAALGKTKLTSVVSGNVKAIYDSNPVNILRTNEAVVGLRNVDVESFYTSMETIGYQYTGPFKALSSILAKHDRATGDVLHIPCPGADNAVSPVAVLDAALQSIFLPSYHTGAEWLRNMPVLTGIKLLRIIPSQWNVGSVGKSSFTYFANQGSNGSEYRGDVEVYSSGGTSTAVQIQGIQAKTSRKPSMERHIFSKTIWKAANPKSDLTLFEGEIATFEVHDFALDLERVAYFYSKELQKSIAVNGYKVTEDHHKKYPTSIDIQLMRVVGENMLQVIRGSTTILEHMVKDDVLNRYYVEALGFSEFTHSLSRLMGQFHHRYPCMKILEIGAGTGGATKSILKQLGNTAYSYTFTDISSGFFPKAQQIFSNESRNNSMTFKVLDAEKDIADQGFVENSYDLVIGSLVFHATRDLESTMRNIRRLLKPGGLLVMLEITNNDQTRLGFIFGSLSGWWRSTDGRLHGPCVGVDRWQTVLSNTGFSGVDSVVSSDDKLAYPFSVIVSQAVDEEIVSLREPLKAAARPSNLTIVCEFSASSFFGTKLQSMLESHYSHISRVESIKDLECRDEDLIIEAQVLDVNLQRDFGEYIASVARLFASKSVRNILWVTKNSRAGSVYATTSIGVAKSLQRQYPQVQLKCLDLDIVDDTTISIAATAILRLRSRELQLGDDNDSKLWSKESEVAVVNGQELIPRVVMDVARNDRYASRSIQTVRDLDVRYFDDGYQNIEMSLNKISEKLYFTSGEVLPPKNIDQTHIAVRVIFSLQTAVFVESQGSTGNLFLIIGTLLDTDEIVIGFSTQQSIIVKTLASWVIPWHVPLVDSLAPFIQVGINVTASSILSIIPTGTTAIVYGASSFASALAKQARKRDIELHLFSDSSSAGSTEVFLHPQTPSRVLQAAIPKEPSTAISIGGDKELFSSIVDNLPHSCNVLYIDDILSVESRVPKAIAAQDLSKVLTVAYTHTAEMNGTAATSIAANLVSLEDISGRFTTNLSLAKRLDVLNWTTGRIPVTITPVGGTGLFSPNVTYWLVGLRRTYTMRLCEWMVENGAKYFVLLSSLPCKATQINYLRDGGAVIEHGEIHKLDFEALQDLYSKIKQNSFPQVGGIIQASAILPGPNEITSDPIKMDLFSININRALNEMFRNTPLDFYVVISHLTAVTRESTYLVASMFSNGMVRERRARGLAASVLNIADVLFRENYPEQQTVSTETDQSITEEEFFDALIETIVAGSPLTSNYECTAGIAFIDKNSPAESVWASDPKFSHLVRLDEKTASAEEESEEKSIATGYTLKAQLAKAANPKEAMEIATDAFIIKLRGTLHMTSKTDSNRSILAYSCDSLGIDSLVAIEIQSWFQDELSVLVPVLEILNGTTLEALFKRVWELNPTTVSN